MDEINNIVRSKRVNSEELRELFDSYNSRISAAYHRENEIYGMLRTAMVCLEMTNSSMMITLSQLSKEGLKTRMISAYTDCIYPSSVADGEKAERHPEFLTIAAKRLNTKSVFLDSDGNTYPSIRVNKTIVSDTADIPDSVLENKLENVIRGDVPYLIRYIKESVISRAHLGLEIESTGEPFRINALRYVPIPGMGGNILKTLSYGGSKRPVMNGDYVLPDLTGNYLFDINRTLCGYFNFKPVETDRIKFDISSELYVSSMHCVAIGIGRVVGELNTYAKKSYIGYKINYPTGTESLTNVKISPSPYASSIKNIKVKIYGNQSDFDSVGNNFLASFIDEYSPQNINRQTAPTVFVLVEIESENETTPTLGTIQLDFV